MPARRPSHATLKDVALRSGCSLQTVSAILGTRAHQFRPAMRQRVAAAVRELDYRPNASARSVRSGRTGCVVVLKGTHPTRNNLTAAILGGITGELDRHDLHGAILTLDDAQLTSEAGLPKLLRQVVADGVLVKYDTCIPSELGELLRRHRTPTVWINSRQVADCVLPDDRAGAAEAVARLRALGHRRIAYLDCNRDADAQGLHHSAVDRLEGYAAAMAAAGLGAQPVLGQLDQPAERLARCAALLAGADRPTAVLCNGVHAAYVCWHAALQAGLRVPRDLALIAIDAGSNELLGQRLALIEVPEAEMGRAAAALLIARIGGAAAADPLRLPCRCLPGDTLAPP